MPNGQVTPQWPQLSALVLVLVSHPLVRSPSQSPNPGAQTNPQTEPLHEGDAFAGAVQAWPHAPQLFGSVGSAAHRPPQLVCPGAQQMPPVQICPPAHAAPHAPQLGGLVPTLISHPSPALPSQSA